FACSRTIRTVCPVPTRRSSDLNLTACHSLQAVACCHSDAHRRCKWVQDRARKSHNKLALCRFLRACSEADFGDLWCYGDATCRAGPPVQAWYLHGHRSHVDGWRVCMDVISNFAARYERTREEEISLEEYLDLCKREPMAYASAAERMLAAI